MKINPPSRTHQLASTKRAQKNEKKGAKPRAPLSKLDLRAVETARSALSKMALPIKAKVFRVSTASRGVKKKAPTVMRALEAFQKSVPEKS